MFSWRNDPQTQKWLRPRKVVLWPRSPDWIMILFHTYSHPVIEFILLQQNTQLYIIRDLKLRLSNYSFRQIFVYKDDTLGFWILSINSWLQYTISLKLNIREVQRNIIIFFLSKANVFLLFKEILFWYSLLRVESWKYDSIIKGNNYIKVLD